MSKFLVLLSLCLCGCTSMFRVQDQIPSEIIMKALDSGTMTLLERASVYTDKSGITIVERVARDSDGKPVTIKIGNMTIPIYERECTIVQGQDLPATIAGVPVGTPVPDPGLSVVKRTPVRKRDSALVQAVKGPIYPHPAAEPVPDVEPELAPVPLVSETPEIETVTFATRENNTEWTLETDAGNKYRGVVSDLERQPDNSTLLTVTLEAGPVVRLRSSGLQAELLKR